MSQGALTVPSDGTRTLDPRLAEDTTAWEATLAGVSDRVQSTSAASIWHARRQGLSRSDIFQT